MGQQIQRHLTTALMEYPTLSIRHPCSSYQMPCYKIAFERSLGVASGSIDLSEIFQG
jgi:hypothetical protein